MRSNNLLVLLLPSTTAFDLAFRGSCRFFLDTADVAEYRSLLPLGMFHGVTCNPTILQRAGRLTRLMPSPTWQNRPLIWAPRNSCARRGAAVPITYTKGILFAPSTRNAW